MAHETEKLVFATNGMGTWTSGTLDEMKQRGLEIICSVDDPDWAKLVSRRTGRKVTDDSAASNSASIEVKSV